MLKSSKWIKGTHPDLPVSDAARQALDERLKRVWYYAKLAAKEPEKDIEYVHQLRVSCRRARTALLLFEDLLPRRRARWLNKTMRELRLAAGDARDLDVLGERLTLIAKQNKKSELGMILESIAKRRSKAQEPLLKSYQKAKRERLPKRSRALLKRLRWRHDQPEPTFFEAARVRLAPPVEEFFTAAAADLSDAEALHEMRIAGKRLRYAMELLAGAFDESFRSELYPFFAEVQDELGIVNDHATAVTMFSEWLPRAQKKDRNGLAAELAELIANEEEQLATTSDQFRASWTEERAAELRARFDHVLGLGGADAVVDDSQDQSEPTDSMTEEIRASSE